MKDNVNFYSNLPEAMPSYFVNLEAKPYQVAQFFSDLKYTSIFCEYLNFYSVGN